MSDRDPFPIVRQADCAGLGAGPANETRGSLEHKSILLGPGDCSIIQQTGANKSGREMLRWTSISSSGIARTIHEVTPTTSRTTA